MIKNNTTTTTAAWFNRENSPTGKDEWITPPYIFTSLGEFDLDPCAPINPPWSIGKKNYTITDNGLIKPWTGRVWCNPPYNNTGEWLSKLSKHNNGIALVFARTETSAWFNYIWNCAAGILFLDKRIKFYHVDGTLPKNSSGAPSALIAYGRDNLITLQNAVKTKTITGKVIVL